MNNNKNIFLDDFYYFKNIKNYKIKKNKNNNLFQRAFISILSRKIDKNKIFIDQKHVLNTINNLDLIKSNNQDNKKIKLHNTNENDLKNIKNEKIFTSFLDVKNNKNTLFSLKTANRINYSIKSTNFIRYYNKKEDLKTNVEPFFLNDSKNSVEWKKSISQRILLSIANKENQAKIYLKPESLGSIYIKINMKDDQVTLNFISNNNEVKKFLDNYVPCLRDSLNKSGILLRKVNIYSSLKNIEVKNSKKVFDEKILNSYKLNNTLNVYNKNIGTTKCQEIDIYV